MASFATRASFHIPDSIPKSYFLGHHQAGLARIKSVLPGVSVVLECRDFRLPLSTQNPTLEEAVRGREKLIIFTKSDLGLDSPRAKKQLRTIYGNDVLFWDKNKSSTTNEILQKLKSFGRLSNSLTGLRVLVVGMPNVGKSTLLNSLRRSGISERTKKAAKTGDQAGVTRKLANAVRIIASEEKGGVGGGVFVLDSPGIFQPYVEDGVTMIKIALAHGIKKGLIRDEILVDYLLYRMNMWNPSIYRHYCDPTDDVNNFLEAVAHKDGKLKAGGLPHHQEAAARVLQQWREGKLGRFVLDDISDAAIALYNEGMTEPSRSLNRAKQLYHQKKRESRTSV